MTSASLDVVEPGLEVIFCGINPGLRAAATGQPFAGRGNRFWQVLYLAGFTPTIISSNHASELLRYGFGITAVVDRPTAGASDVSAVEFRTAGRIFLSKMECLSPRYIAFLGKAAYGGFTGKRCITWGRQAEILVGCGVWILPNPSGRNRSFSLSALVDAYAELWVAVAESR